jgi:two-component system, chemotaxis family, CheB/CheR fusion protein
VAPVSDEDDPAFEALLVHLRDARGFDFTGYKRASLTRRVERRMAQLGMTGHGEYLDHLEVHQAEFTALFNTILINVTAFFRDADAWEHLRTEVLAELLENKGEHDPIRVWSAGCASGEEAYTLAIVLAEALGVEDFRRRVKIYATDVDEEALGQARQAVYGERAVRGVDPVLLERYFERVAAGWTFRKDLRRSVIFGRNDLVQDAPISRIDLLVCRNALMYFNAETQARVLGRFHFALADSGVLFLGKAEMLLSHSALFVPVDLKRRIFRKVGRANGGAGTAGAGPAPLRSRPEPVGLDRLRAESQLSGPHPHVVITVDGLVALVNREAERVFGTSARDIGRPFRDLELSYRPAELRPWIEQAQVERRTVQVTDVRFDRGDERTCFDVQISPLISGGSGLLGVGVTFVDVTAVRGLRDELDAANRQLETTHEELQSTVEELETTNEELQSTVEELETTNEELQSTNEELETMNEELQSTNDELQTINEELQDRTGELDEANGFLETILGSLHAGVVVLGREQQVQVWNHRSEDLWGLRREEAPGEHFLNLDIGLPVDRLRPAIRRVLAGDEGDAELALSAVNRRGRTIAVRVTASPLRVPGADPAGVILLVEQDGPE